MNNALIFLALAHSLLSFTACSDDENNDDSNAVNPPASEVRHVMNRSAKRGVGYNFRLPEDMFLLKGGISWFYNWATKTSSTVQEEAKNANVTFVPMTWNNNYSEDDITATVKVFDDKYILAFNEPNLVDQARMTPAQAAEFWPRLKEYAKANDLKIISPAMNYGTLPGYSDPLTWLDEFFAQPGVSIDDIHAIALHCYMNSASSVKGYVDKFAKYGKPIWMTEFCAWDGGVADADAQIAYMSEVVAYFEENPNVERYAWFEPRHTPGAPYMQLLVNDELTDAGKVYVNFSSFDKQAYALSGSQWPATSYQSTNASEGVEAGKAYSAAPSLHVATDPESIFPIEIKSITTKKWVEYGLDARYDLSTLSLRLKTLVPTTFTITVDGKESVDTEELTTKGEWKTVEIPVSISGGLHNVRLAVKKGSTSLSSILFK